MLHFAGSTKGVICLWMTARCLCWAAQRWVVLIPESCAEWSTISVSSDNIVPAHLFPAISWWGPWIVWWTICRVRHGLRSYWSGSISGNRRNCSLVVIASCSALSHLLSSFGRMWELVEWRPRIYGRCIFPRSTLMRWHRKSSRLTVWSWGDALICLSMLLLIPDINWRRLIRPGTLQCGVLIQMLQRWWSVATKIWRLSCPGEQCRRLTSRILTILGWPRCRHGSVSIRCLLATPLSIVQLCCKGLSSSW